MKIRFLILVALGVFCVAAPGLAQSDSPEPDDTATATALVAFGTDIDRETRTLVNEGREFGPDHERIICLTRVQGLEPPASVTHAWYYEGKTMARVDLKVGSLDWRTWSSKRYLPAWTGRWEVKVLDEAGKVLAAADFVITD